MKWWKQIRLWIGMFTALLMCIEPTAWAVSTEDQQIIRARLEQSGMTTREVPLKEFYEKYKDDFSYTDQVALQTLMALSPDFKFPKLNVSKIKGAKGEEDIQLQFVKDNNSGVITLVARGKVFAKIGSETFTAEDMIDSHKYIAKMEKAFSDKSRFPASVGDEESPAKLKLLAYSDFQVLGHEAQLEYITKMRDLLKSMEDLQNEQLNSTQAVDKAKNVAPTKKTSSYYFIENFLEKVALAQESDPPAFQPYDEDNYGDNKVENAKIKVVIGSTPCMYAGNMADYGCDTKNPNKNGLCPAGSKPVCGGLGSSFYKQHLDPAITGSDNLTCSAGGRGNAGIKCYAPIYGEVCVPQHTINATGKCNDFSHPLDFFKQFKDKDGKSVFRGKDEWNKYKGEVEKQISKQKDFCDKQASGALTDQPKTCYAFNKRIEAIKKMECPFGKDGDTKAMSSIPKRFQDSFKGSYCDPADKKEPPKPVGGNGSTQPGTKPAEANPCVPSVDTQKVTCDNQPVLPADEAKKCPSPRTEGKCKGYDPFFNKEGLAGTICGSGQLSLCDGDNGKKYYRCENCTPGTEVANDEHPQGSPGYWRCKFNTQQEKKIADDDKDKKPKSMLSSIGKWFSDNKTTILMCSAIGLFMYLGYRSQKAALNGWYASNYPTATATPVPGTTSSSSGSTTIPSTFPILNGVRTGTGQ